MGNTHLHGRCWVWSSNSDVCYSLKGGRASKALRWVGVGDSAHVTAMLDFTVWAIAEAMVSVNAT